MWLDLFVHLKLSISEMKKISHYLTRDEFSELNLMSTWVPAIHLAMRILLQSILIGSVADSYIYGHLVVFCFLYFLCGATLQFWGYAGFSHELYHGKVFKSKKVNRFLFIFSSYILWNNPGFFESSHRHHHNHTFDHDDVEGFAKQDFQFWSLLFYLTIDPKMFGRRIFYLTCNSVGRLPSFDPFRLTKINAKNEIIIIHSRRILFFQALLLSVLFFTAGPLLGVLLWLLPFVGTLPNRMLAASQHIGLSSFQDEGPIFHSRTLILPGWLSFLYSGMNYHCEHHLYPTIPYYRLSKLHFILKSRGALGKDERLDFFWRRFWELQSSER